MSDQTQSSMNPTDPQATPSVRVLRDKNRAIAEALRTDSSYKASTLIPAEQIGDPILLGETLATEAVRSYLRGDISAAIAHNKAAVELLGQQDDDESDPFFRWLIQTTGGITAESQGDLDAALRNFAAAAEIGRSARIIDLTARSLMSLGYVANRKSDPVTALGYYLELLHLPNLNDSTAAGTYMYLAELFEDQRQWGLAMLYLSEGLAKTGQLAPDIEGAMRGRYAGLLARTGDLEAAEEALELAGQITIPNTIHAAKLAESRGRFLYESGELEEAQRVVRTVLSLLREQGQLAHIGKPAVLLCEVMLAQGEPEGVLAAQNELDYSTLPIQRVRDLLQLRIQAHRELEQFEEASQSHEQFASLVEGNGLDVHAFYRLHRQLVDAHSLEAQHATLISRQIELTRLQDELVELMDQVANDLNSPLTALQLVFDALALDPSLISVTQRLPNAWAAIERISLLAELFLAAQDEESDTVESARV